MDKNDDAIIKYKKILHIESIITKVLTTTLGTSPRQSTKLKSLHHDIFQTFFHPNHRTTIETTLSDR